MIDVQSKKSFDIPYWMDFMIIETYLDKNRHKIAEALFLKALSPEAFLM